MTSKVDVPVPADTRPVIEYRDATWRAFNGHQMTGRERRVDGGEWRSEGWSATHSDECQCDDWDGGAGWEF